MQKNHMMTALSAAGLASAILVWFEEEHIRNA
jgi:hypothetical protein